MSSPQKDVYTPVNESPSLEVYVKNDNDNEEVKEAESDDKAQLLIPELKYTEEEKIP